MPTLLLNWYTTAIIIASSTTTQASLTVYSESGWSPLCPAIHLCLALVRALIAPLWCNDTILEQFRAACSEDVTVFSPGYSDVTQWSARRMGGVDGKMLNMLRVCTGVTLECDIVILCIID